MARALELYLIEADDRVRHMTILRERFEAGLRAQCAPVEIHGADVSRLPHTTNVAFGGVDRQALVLALDFAGVYCSSGSACASGSSEPSPTLLAMGCSPEQVAGSVRFSLGHETTTEHMIVALAQDRRHRAAIEKEMNAEFGVRNDKSGKPRERLMEDRSERRTHRQR
ncbi:MAG: aminotransferase class V-fold PLP-dependent enzyme [Pirellulales bacterium]